MKLYSGLIKIDSDQKISDIVAIAEEFSWNVFFFGPLWFLFKKMWMEFFLFVSVIVVFNGLFSRFAIEGNLFILAFVFMVASNAKFWYFNHLNNSKKYQFIGIVFADNVDEARVRLIETFFDSDLKNKALASLIFKLSQQNFLQKFFQKINFKKTKKHENNPN